MESFFDLLGSFFSFLFCFYFLVVCLFWLPLQADRVLISTCLLVGLGVLGDAVFLHMRRRVSRAGCVVFSVSAPPRGRAK